MDLPVGTQMQCVYEMQYILSLHLSIPCVIIVKGPLAYDALVTFKTTIKLKDQQ